MRRLGRGNVVWFERWFLAHRPGGGPLATWPFTFQLHDSCAFQMGSICATHKMVFIGYLSVRIGGEQQPGDNNGRNRSVVICGGVFAEFGKGPLVPKFHPWSPR